MSAAPATAQLPDASVIRQEITTIQRDGFRAATAGLVIVALALLAGQEALPDRSNLFLPCDLLIGLAVVVWMLSSRSYLLAAWTMVLGVIAVVMILVWWAWLPEAIILLALPAGLAALLINPRAGALVAAVCTALLAMPPQAPVAPGAPLLVLTFVQMWSTVGLTVLIARPLFTAMQWSWHSYERSSVLLEQARDYQVQLKQAMEDLSSANVQLTRLNEFAQTMRQAAEDARHIKEQFVANVSHELRTPLNMIIGFAELITSSPESYGAGVPPALLADLQVIRRNSRHLSDLIDDVLDLSQIEAGRMALSKERVDLVEVLDSARVAVSGLFASKSLYLELEAEADLPPVLCDRTRIREVALNLLSNAARFTELGGVRIRVWSEGDDVVVAVADTGPGIAPEALPRLFQPFEQLDGSIRRKHGGSGLGLTISKGFVELHGGTMWIESTPGSGSTVFFRLPIGAPAPLHGGVVRWLHPEWEYRQRTRPRSVPPAVVRPRLIILETGDTLRRMIGRYMDDVELVAVADLNEAVAELARTPAQAVVVKTPSLAIALQRVTSEASLPAGVPFIMCSMPETTNPAAALGASDYLVKPISQERLLATLDRVAPRAKSVLIVDDEPEAQQLFMRMLASSGRGYRVLTAPNGNEAMRILRRRKPGAVLLDLVMPEMDGFRVLAECSHDPALRRIPIVVMSAQDPSGRPIVSSGVAVTMGGGLASHHVLDCIEAMRAILAPGFRPDGAQSPENPHG
jgi:signal transduction histidine kinase/DNA-binding response OmpR family regulator